MKQTNLEGIKNVSKLLFDAVKIKSNDQFKFLVQHPFATNSLIAVPEDTEGLDKYYCSIEEIINNKDNHINYTKSYLEYLSGLLKFNKDNNLIDITLPKGREVFRNFVFKQIEEAKNLISVLMLINKAWYMTFLKYTEVYLSAEDLGTLLGECWVMQEYPSRDLNTSLEEIIEWFRKANKTSLMEEKEYSTYKTLLSNCNGEKDSKLTVYRGVSHKGSPKGLSWTTDIDKARWFSTRFGDNHSRVYKMEINLLDYADCVLAVFLGRGESEIVVDTTRCNNWEVIE